MNGIVAHCLHNVKISNHLLIRSLYQPHNVTIYHCNVALYLGFCHTIGYGHNARRLFKTPCRVSSFITDETRHKMKSLCPCCLFSRCTTRTPTPPTQREGRCLSTWTTWPLEKPLTSEDPVGCWCIRETVWVLMLNVQKWKLLSPADVPVAQHKRWTH